MTRERASMCLALREAPRWGNQFRRMSFSCKLVVLCHRTQILLLMRMLMSCPCIEIDASLEDARRVRTLLNSHQLVMSACNHVALKNPMLQWWDFQLWLRSCCAWKWVLTILAK